MSEAVQDYNNNQIAALNEAIKQFNKLVDRVEVLENGVKQLRGGRDEDNFEKS